MPPKDFGSTQNLVGFIEVNNKRVLGNMKEAESRLENKMTQPAVKCDIGDPLLDVFRSQRDCSTQIMDNQLLTYSDIVKRLDGKNGVDANSQGQTGAFRNRTDSSLKEIKSKWFSIRGYNLKDVMLFLAILALAATAVIREYTNYQRSKKGTIHESSATVSASGNNVR